MTVKKTSQKQKQKKANNKLSANMRIFKNEYLIDRNATRAYKIAYPSVKNDNVAAVNAHALLRKPKMEKAIEDALAEQQKRTEITADKVLKETAAIAFSDIRGLFDESGRLKKIHELDDDIAKAIAGIDVATVKDGDDVLDVKKIKLWSKNDALDKLGKHFKLFIERKEHTGEGGGPIQSETTYSLSPELEELFNEVTGQKDADKAANA
jgi:phage terminase small subunit